ncbi:MAG: amidohydrolase family protein, partial [Chloroflexi bacterium]|nr:amidohydrolase family protein [Chloroflexota bacterium]
VLLTLSDTHSETPPSLRCCDDRLNSPSSDRLMWGTDFPFIVEQTGYTKGWEIADKIQPAMGPGLADQILGGTCERLFGTWGD